MRIYEDDNGVVHRAFYSHMTAVWILLCDLFRRDGIPEGDIYRERAPVITCLTCATKPIDED